MNEIKKLEEASQILLAPPNVVTSLQRQEAEKIFLDFRKSSMPYSLCRTILENCRNDYVLFQAASAIKESVVREWPLLQVPDIKQLHSFLLQYVTENVQLESYVREQVLQAVAVIFKRASLDSNTLNREAMFNDVSQLINSGDITLQLIACSILTALLNEFSSSTKSSCVGFTWEFHNKCKTQFEKKDLKRVFLFSLQVLQELERNEPALNRQITALFNRMLAITEQVLSWAFVPKHIPKRVIGTFLTNQSPSFKPPLSWSDTVLNKNLIDMFVRIHKKVRLNSEMAHHSLQCLSQLATVNGVIFKDEDTKMNFLSVYLTAFMTFLNECDLQDFEALGVANILHNLTMFYPMSVFLKLNGEVLQMFIQHTASLTCKFGRAAALEEAMVKDDTLYQEAYEQVLRAWMTILTDPVAIPENELKPHALEIFNCYVQCHLAPPDGTRKQLNDGNVADDDDEYNEIEEDDRTKFADQLSAIGEFGRLLPEHSFDLLARLMEDRVARLQSQLQLLSQRAQHSQADDILLQYINEDLHWLLLISTAVMSDNAEGETALIPDSIMKFSSSNLQKTNLATTLKVLSSPSKNITELGGEATTDPVVRLVSAILRLCDVEDRAIETRLAQHLSPQVASTCMWFLQNWVQAYLLPNERYYTELSEALVLSFGNDSEGGLWTLTYLMNKIVSNLNAWSSEVQLIDDTLQLLVALVEKRERAVFVAKCPSFWKLAKDTSTNAAPLDMLAPSSKRALTQALVLAGSASFEGSTKDEYWNMVLLSFHERFKSVVKHPDLKKSLHNAAVKREVTSLLEAVIGVIEASCYNNADVLFHFLHPLLVECCPLLELYHNYEDVVGLILEVFNATASKLICFLNQAETNKIYECSLSIIGTYAKHNIGRKVSRCDNEEEQYSDLLTLINMLSSLLSKDFMADLGGGARGDVEAVSAADVVLYGLKITVPLMNAELLKFPALCTSYMKLATYLSEIYPEKVCQLPDDLLSDLCVSLQLGLTSNLGADISKLCLENVAFLGEHVSKSKLLQGSSIHKALQLFTKLVFDMLIVDSTFDMDLFDSACQAFFSLICCNQDYYKQLVNELLSEHPSNYARLVDAFTNLTPPGTQLVVNRLNKRQFMDNFEHFLINVRGFLCVR